MNRLSTTLSVLALGTVLAGPTLADMTVHLKHRRTFTLPCRSARRRFHELQRGRERHQRTDAADACAPTSGATNVVPLVPGIAQPAAAAASLAPPPAMALPGAQPKASGR
jgi:hypothetical protein